MRSPKRRCRKRSSTLAMWIRTLWMRSRPGACSTAWWAIRSLPCFGTRCVEDCPRAACKPFEYWTLDALLHADQQPDKSFTAKFIGIDGEPARVANGKDKDGKE